MDVNALHDFDATFHPRWVILRNFPATPRFLDYQGLLIFVPVLLFSVIAHEYAHGYAALKQGDRQRAADLIHAYYEQYGDSGDSAVSRRFMDEFARILLTPAAPPDGVRQVLVLEPIGAQLPPPPQEPAEDPKKGPPAKKAVRK